MARLSAAYGSRTGRSPEALLRVSAAETRCIGQALHDEVGQQLTGLTFLARALADDLALSDPRAADQARRILRGLERGLFFVRRLARGIIVEPETVHDLRVALVRLCESVHESSSVSCRLRWGIGRRRLSREACRQLYRIAQESLHNAVRHGAACCVMISLRTDMSGIELRVVDDGAGLPKRGLVEGTGLEIMRFRAGIIGGAVSIGGRRGGGVSVVCRAPLGKKAR